MTSILDSEIHEQPAALGRLLQSQGDVAARLAEEIRRHGILYLLIAARGSSDNAARYAQYLFGVCNGLPVALATPSLYTLYDSPPRMTGALVVAISQSGRSPDIISVVEAGRTQGRPTLAITNDPDSPLGRAAEWVLPLEAGEERAVAATKTYTNSLAALALLSARLAGDAQRLADLKRMPAILQAALDRLEPALARIERYCYVERSAVIARGYTYATAFEVALKIKELTRVVTEPYSAADFLHGPISVLDPGFPLILVAPSGRAFGDMGDLAQKAQERGAELIVISDSQQLLRQAKTPLPLPDSTPEWLSPLVATLPGQLFAMTLATAKGYDVDRPAGLRKVTETR